MEATTKISALEIVQQCYADFGSGNIPGLMNALSDNIEWTDPGHLADLYIGKRKGKASVMDFFQKLGQYLSVSKFELHDFFPSGNKVAVTGHIAGKVNSNGVAYAADWAMAWEINDGGKVVRHQLYLDTASLAKAMGL